MRSHDARRPHAPPARVLGQSNERATAFNPVNCSAGARGCSDAVRPSAASRTSSCLVDLHVPLVLVLQALDPLLVVQALGLGHALKHLLRFDNTERDQLSGQRRTERTWGLFYKRKHNEHTAWPSAPVRGPKRPPQTTTAGSW